MEWSWDLASQDLASLHDGMNKKKKLLREKKRTIEGHHMMAAVLYIPHVHLPWILVSVPTLCNKNIKFNCRFVMNLPGNSSWQYPAETTSSSNEVQENHTFLVHINHY